MRLNDLNDGSIKTLLILALLAANIVAALPSGSARVSQAGFRRPAETNFPSAPRLPAKFALARMPSPARAVTQLAERARPGFQTRALPDQLTP
jgi:hypothetical protein